MRFLPDVKPLVVSQAGRYFLKSCRFCADYVDATDKLKK
jgi:hypothetical protein